MKNQSSKRKKSSLQDKNLVFKKKKNSVLKKNNQPLRKKNVSQDVTGDVGELVEITELCNCSGLWLAVLKRFLLRRLPWQYLGGRGDSSIDE